MGKSKDHVKFKKKQLEDGENFVERDSRSY